MEAASLAEDERRVDEREVRERLREVAEQPLGSRVVLLRQQPHVVAQSSSRSNSSRASRRAPAARGRRRARTSTAGTPPRRRQAVHAPSSRRAVARTKPSTISSRSIASHRPDMRGSVAGRKPTRGIIRTLASSSSDPYDCVNAACARLEAPRRPRRGSLSRVARQRSTGPRSSELARRDRTARSNATQAITFEWVKWRRGPRTSQMPLSGSSPTVLEPVRAASARAPSVGVGCRARAPRGWYMASITSP